MVGFRVVDAGCLFAVYAVARLNLVSIHPWRDGNGRMSRCLQTPTAGSALGTDVMFGRYCQEAARGAITSTTRRAASGRSS